MSTLLSKKEVTWSAISVDTVGQVFSWDGRIFRAIKHESVHDIRTLLESGLVDALVKEGLFPKTHISEYAMDGFGLIVEHEKIAPVVYPYEWSFDMTKAAAETILRVNEVARTFGYQTKDCHGANILFDGAQPKFVDLGSFVKRKNKDRGWIAYEEYLTYYHYPLRLWAKGMAYAGRARYVTNRELPLYELLYMVYPITRILPSPFFSKVVAWYVRLKRLHCLESKRCKDFFGTRFGSVISYIAKSRYMPLQTVRFNRLQKKLKKMHTRRYDTTWGEYHSDMKPNSRFNRVAELLESHDVRTVVELAGNQGLFANFLIARGKIEKVICTDYDQQAVDVLYKNISLSKSEIVPAVHDFIFPDKMFLDKNPADRFRSDAVVALAVTHHLILTHNIPLDYILSSVVSYSREYVAIEFMPLGMYSDNDPGTKSSVPDWYTQDWFRTSFEQYCEILLVEQLEPNRILFFGRVKNV